MALTVTHALVSAIADDPVAAAAGEVVPSDWNAAHIVTGAGREFLTATRTYYVRTDGNDSNDGLADSAGGAWLTIQRAINEAKTVDKSSFGVEIRVGAGTYNESPIWVDRDETGRVWDLPTINLVGNVASPAAHVISQFVDFRAFGGNIRGFTLGAPVYAYEGSYLNLYSCVLVEEAYAEGGVIYLEDCTIASGTKWCALVATMHGVIQTYNLSLSGTPHFTGSFAYADLGGLIELWNAPTGGATGKRYRCRGGGAINVYGGNETYLPGDEGGECRRGGIYIGPELPSEALTYPASEALAAGDLVHVWNDSGTMRARKADATADGKRAIGYVAHSVVSTEPAQVRMQRTTLIAGLSGLTPGADYYLSTTAGGLTSVAPSTSGNVVQRIGVALSSTTLLFDPGQEAVVP